MKNKNTKRWFRILIILINGKMKLCKCISKRIILEITYHAVMKLSFENKIDPIRYESLLNILQSEYLLQKEKLL